MDYASLHAAITTGPLVAACAPYVHTNDMPRISGQEARAKDQAIADILNTTEAIKVVGSRLIGIGTVLNALGPETGSAVLDALYAAAETNRPLWYALKLLEKGELDVGLEATRGQIDLLSSGAAWGAAIKALAETPETVTAAQVSIALRGPRE